MALSLFIPDGYTLKARVPGRPHLFPTVDITYRASGPDERIEYRAPVTAGKKEISIGGDFKGRFF